MNAVLAPFTWLECRRCRTWLPATAEYFAPRARAGNPLCCVCRACAAAVGAASAAKAGPRAAHPQGSDGERTCSGCGETWPCTLEFFHYQGGRWLSLCRACESEARARRRGLPSAQPVRHASDAIAPLLTGAGFFGTMQGVSA